MFKPFLSAFALFATVSSVHADKLQVVTDIAPVHSLVSMVTGELADITLLVTGAGSPHDFALKPSQARAMQSADAIVFIGTPLTPWMAKPLDTLAKNGLKVELLETAGTTELEMRDSEIFEDHEAEHHDHGHDHGEHDPHAWLSPANAMNWLGIMAKEFAKLDPDNAETFEQNAQDAIAKLQTLKTKLSNDLAPLNDRPFVLFHDATQYFENSFGLNALGAMTLADGDAPSAKSMSEIQSLFVKHNIVCVMSEPQTNPSLVNAIVPTNIKQTLIDPLGTQIEDGAEKYTKLLENLATAMHDCLAP